MNGEWINCFLLPGLSVLGGLQVYSVLCEVCSNKLEQVHGHCIESRSDPELLEPKGCVLSSFFV
jgi:hypothetical protein